MRPAVKVARIAGASRQSRLETEPTTMFALLSSSLRQSIFCIAERFCLLICVWMKSQSTTTQVKATERYFPVALFVVLYKLVLNFESVCLILRCGHSNESYRLSKKSFVLFNMAKDLSRLRRSLGLL